MSDVISGSEIVCGVKIGSLTGETIREKVEFMSTMDAQSSKELAKTAGFSVLTTEGQLLIVPRGYIVLTVPAKEGCSGLRWSWCKDEEENKLSKEDIRMLFDSFQSLETDPIMAAVAGALDVPM